MNPGPLAPEARIIPLDQAAMVAVDIGGGLLVGKLGESQLRCNSLCLRHKGLLRELNPGPLAPEARIIPLDQAAIVVVALLRMCYDCGLCICDDNPSSCATHATPVLLYFVPKTHMCEGTPGFEPGTC